jgi:hypothetical protein
MSAYVISAVDTRSSQAVRLRQNLYFCTSKAGITGTQVLILTQPHLLGRGSGSEHTSAYVAIRQCTRQRQRAYVSIRQPHLLGRGSGSERVLPREHPHRLHLHTSACVSVRQHTSAYVSIRQHTSACVSMRQHISAYVSVRQQASAYVSIPQHTCAPQAYQYLYFGTSKASKLSTSALVKH